MPADNHTCCCESVYCDSLAGVSVVCYRHRVVLSIFHACQRMYDQVLVRPWLFQLCQCVAIVWSLWLRSDVVCTFVLLLVVQQLRLLHAH